MKIKPQAIVFFFLILLSILFIYKNSNDTKEHSTTTLHSLDGPYIYSKENQISILRVAQKKDSSFFIKKQTFPRGEKTAFSTYVNNTDKDSFTFTLAQQYNIPLAVHEPKGKILVTSDIEGNFNAFHSILIGNNVIDDDYNWTFGSGHLVICGDMMDRGTEVLPCLWLLYKLDQEAKKHNGQVHFILGNHDVMNLQLDTRYIKSKYLELAKIVSGITDDKKKAYEFLMSDTNELVKWIKSKNTIEKIGNNLFVHGGISDLLIDTGLTLEETNSYIRKNIRKNLIRNPGKDEYANLIFGNKGPLWYRGLVKNHSDYEKINEATLNSILQFYGVQHIIVGHTIVDNEVTSDFNGKVIRVDIKQPKEKFTGKGQALLIENDGYYRVNDLGEKFKMDIN
ncbi:metallophosphoesterase [Spongiimicrobium salis]|uniref:metallophosphoesterase n=1 Tax=Spongiimicrobium salis TaxID=1667022 RepID=UPI00374DA3AE